MISTPNSRCSPPRRGSATPACDNWRGLWPFVIAGQRPQVIALGLGRWEVADHLLDGHWVHIGEPAWNQHLTADLKSAITILHSFGAKVVLLTMPYVDPRNRQADGLPWSEYTPARPGPTTRWCARWRRCTPAWSA